ASNTEVRNALPIDPSKGDAVEPKFDPAGFIVITGVVHSAGSGLAQITDDLRQKPRSPLRLVDPVLDQTVGSRLARLVADVMGATQESRKLQIVRTKLLQHLVWRNIFGIVIHKALVARNVANRAEGGSADFAGSFRNVVGHGEDLPGLLVE